MRTAIVIVLLVLPTVAVAQGGHIGIYSDSPGWSDCNLVEAVGAPNYIYVVHLIAVEASVSQFKIEGNWDALRLIEDYGPNLHIGSTPNNTIYEGMTLYYAGCKPLPRLLITLMRIPFSPTPVCGASLQVAPDPTAATGQIEVTACDNTTILAASGGFLLINGDPSLCFCDFAVEETSWSRVKALYR